MTLTTIASIGLLTFLGITSAEEPSNLIGKTDFRPGDSIHITAVQRGAGFLTVTADYELASEPEAKISLFITVTKGDGKSKIVASQYKKISKGKGTVTLHHPAVSEGMPHVSFYPSGGGSSFGGVYFGTQAEADASQKMTKKAQPHINPIETKLKTIVLPSVIFSNATADEAVDFLRIKSRALDTSTTEPKGVNILLQSRDMASSSITLDLRDVTLGEAIRYVADLAGLEMRLNSSAVLLATKGSPVQPSMEAEDASPIILPKAEFHEATIDEAIAFIRIKSRDIDPAKKGINVLLKPGVTG
ncbi:MAG: hypothetical protein NTV80_24350, partial [Verrucomicrobia bacterium]|nr:hypothetical protein [Verrucomicrobiota bacterium]